MAESDPPEEGTLQIAASASSGVEADLICQRLEAAGIPALTQRAIGGPEWGTSGGQYVYVEPEHLERAKEILARPDDLSDEELARQSQEAGALPGEDGSDGTEA